jgi:hypothetical protein
MLATLLLCGANACPQAAGHGGGGDIAVFSADGQVDVGFAVLDDFDIEQVSFDPLDSVFQAILVPQPPFMPFELGSAEPGYDANEGELPPGANVVVNVLAVDYWNGVGPVAFAPATGVAGAYEPASTLTDELGGFHKHYTFGLRDLTADAAPIADGVYLAALSVSVDGLADSDPFYLVALVDQHINGSADPEGDAEALGEAVIAYLEDPATGAPVYGGQNYAFYAEAIAYVERLAAVPEPATAGVALWGVALAALRRARRS